MKQITVTDSNSWEREKFSFIFNNPSREFVEFSLDAANYDSKLSVKICTLHTASSVIELNQNSRNSYMNRYGFYVEPDISKITPSKGYYELFYKAVGINKEVK